MALDISIGFSQDEVPEKAAQIAALDAKKNLNSDGLNFAFVFSTVDYDPSVTLPVIYNTLQGMPILGCSTAGLVQSTSIKTSGIAILTVHSNDIQCGTGHIENINTFNPYQAGSMLANNCIEKYGRHGRAIFLFFIDGLLAGNQQFTKGIQDILGTVFPTVGIGSSDDFTYKASFQIYQNRILRNSATGLILGGHLNVGIGNRHGWRPLGKPRIIDKVEGNIIKSISGYRASYLYEEYLGDEALDLQTSKGDKMSILYPLGIFVEGNKEYLLRNALSIGDDGSIVCQGDVPEKAEVHLMIGNKETCKHAAFEAAQEAKNNLLGKQPKAILVFISFARLKLFGRTAFQEIEEIKKVFAPDVPIFGMYSNGEICPFQSNERFKKALFQNCSIVVLAIS